VDNGHNIPQRRKVEALNARSNEMNAPFDLTKVRDSPRAEIVDNDDVVSLRHA
jgi:hypothetical protein